MSIKKRLIARLDIKGNRLIKGVRFEGVKVIGDPSEIIEDYLEKGIDELFYSDAVASLYGRNSLGEILKEASKKCFVPITAGGGIRSVEDGRRLLAAGADKLAINTAAVKEPELLNQLSKRFGSQCVVLSVQARRSTIQTSGWEIMIESGREKTSLDLKDWIVKAVSFGVGEIFLTSVDQDGTQNGPDNNLIEFVSDFVDIPLVACGGFNSKENISKVLSNNKVSAVAIGSALHYGKLEIKDLKTYITAKGIKIRNSLYQNEGFLNSRKENKKNSIKVIVIDYGMGNTQSLINALTTLNYEVILSNQVSDISDGEIVILPGVGSFPEGMRELEKRKFVDALKKRAKAGKSIIGICLGMQLLFESSTEIKFTKGLNLLKGNVVHLQSLDEKTIKTSEQIKVPNIGWNNISLLKFEKSIDLLNSEIFSSEYYFVHSYGVQISQIANLQTVLRIKDIPFISMAIEKNICGFQFHPERSGEKGLFLLDTIIKNLVHKES